ncbi:MAG: toll/interleukin-1 receptor domain-containing protein [Bacteroidaceae bacterium]|nr:toll/interleukin-1 receptor domain-containing protein [Bacteroidaceae bacterium]
MNDNDIIIKDPDIVIMDGFDSDEETMWELLVDKIMKGEVIPVIGENIVLEGKTSVKKLLISHLSKTMGVESKPKSYSQLLFDSNNKKGKELIYGKLSQLININQDKFTPSKLLKRILSIQQFPFVITTTIDYTVENTMRDIWNKRERDLKVLVFNNDPKDIPASGDISKDSDVEIPTIYYMFGKANTPRLNSFVVTDEDMLSFCQSWLTEDKHPQKLSRVLGDKFLLFLGCNYPDWLIRFIWYSMRQKLDKSGMLVDEEVEDSLIDFLNRINVNTDKNPESVISEIEKRVAKRMIENNKYLFEAPKERTDVFISYSRMDETMTENLYNALTKRGLNVWYDRKNLAAGDKWLEKINTAIKTTKFCVVIISKSMLSQVNESHVYRKEWNMAIEHSRGMGSKRGFIIPVLLDDVDLYDESLDLPNELKTHNALSLSESCTMADIAQCVLDRVNGLAK